MKKIPTVFAGFEPCFTVLDEWALTTPPDLPELEIYDHPHRSILRQIQFGTSAKSRRYYVFLA